jgi:hypothetical protein
MSKILYSMVRINDAYILKNLEEDELLDYVKRQLAKEMAEYIVNNEEFVTLKREHNLNFGEQFTMSLIIVDPVKYKQLSGIIKLLDLKCTDENGNTIFLKDFL